jgi:hypothetical protein
MLQHVGRVNPPPANEYLVHYWRDTTGVWQYDVIVAFPDFGRMFTPSIAMSPNTMLPCPNVTWEYSDPNPGPMRSKVYYWTPTLPAPELVASGSVPRCLQYPTIALNLVPRAHILWQDSLWGAVRHSYREGANNWHTPPDIVALEAKHPCADECGGSIYAVWEQGTVPDIYIGRLVTDTTWQTCPVCSTDYQSEYPVLEDSNVVWSEATFVPGNHEIFYSRWTGGGGTCGTEPVNVSETSSLSAYPQGCYHTIGESYGEPLCNRFYIVWTEHFQNHEEVMYSPQPRAQ